MLTEEEINQLIEAQKKVFPVKADLESLESKMETGLETLKAEIKNDIKDEIDGLGKMIKNSFDNVEQHFEKIENQNHEVRIRRIEDALLIK